MPKFYDGIELDYLHRLAPNKYITAAWVLSHIRPSGFRFGGLYTFRVQDDTMVIKFIIYKKKLNYLLHDAKVQM